MIILALSPHLDDAAYSAGGTLRRLADAGHRVVVATLFTLSVPNPTGFALACQTDKGLAPNVDYMALRRGEDLAAMAALGAEARHLDLPEAPHRGYASAKELFGPIRPDDAATTGAVATRVRTLIAELVPGLVLAPQGLGGHADHVHLVRALLGTDGPPVVWWRDTPYAIRTPEARPPEPLGPESCPVVTPIAATLGAKLDACAAYASQNGFQFGGDAATREGLARFAAAEGEGEPAERFVADPAAAGRLHGLL